MTLTGRVSFTKARKILGVGKNTLMKYHEAGKIGFVRVGRGLWTSYGEIDRFQKEWLNVSDKERLDNDKQLTSRDRKVSE